MRFAERREEDREENGGQISYRDSKNGSCPQRNFRGRIRFNILKYQPIRARGEAACSTCLFCAPLSVQG